MDYLDSRNVTAQAVTYGVWAVLLDTTHRRDRAAYNIETAVSRLCYLRGAVAQLPSRRRCQLFQLGVLFIELALGQQVERLVPHRVHGVKISILWKNRYREVEAYDAAELVASATNKQFGDIVEFCLSVLPNQGMVAVQNVDMEYTRKVMEP